MTLFDSHDKKWYLVSISNETATIILNWEFNQRLAI